MAVSIVTYTGDGSTTQYVITFEYISRDDVVVTIDGVAATFSFVNDTTVEFSSAPAVDSTIVIKRGTPSAPLVDFTDGSTLFEADLDLAHQQSRYLAEEARDIAEDAKSTVDANITNIDIVADISTDVTTVAGQISPTNNISTLGGIASDITTAAGISTAISNVSSISSAVSTVSSDSADVQNLASISADLQTLADLEDGTTATNALSDLAAISSQITSVAADQADIGVVSSNIAAVSTVATNINHVIDVANDLNEAVSEIETVANDLNEATSEIEIVSNNIADVQTVGTNISSVSTVAGLNTEIANLHNISSDIVAVNNNSTAITSLYGLSSEIQSLDSISTDISTVSGISADVSVVATNVQSVANFADKYEVSSTAPSSPTEGLLWFDTATDTMKVYNGSSFQNAGSSVNGTSSRGSFTATAGQTTFTTTGYDSGFIDIYANGVKQVVGTDVTATNGTTFTFASGLAAGDVVEYVAYGTFQLTSVYNQSQSDARYLQLTGGTLSGDLIVGGNLTISGTTTTVNSTTLDVADLNITVANGAADAAAANGAGLTVDGANATFNYAATGDKWTMNKLLDVTGGVNTTDDIRIATAPNTTRRVYALGGTGPYALNSTGGAAIAFNRDASNNDEIAFETHAQGAAHAERMRIGNYGQLGFNGANYGTSGQVLTSNGSTAAPSWQTVGFTTNVVTTSSTASANNHYYLNAATVTLTLPASPSVGDEVRISEVAGNTDCVIGRNGSNIMGDASDLTIDTAYLVLSLRYVDATIGWAFS